MKYIYRTILFLFALNLMAMGIALYLKADIGVGPWDVLHNNLYEYYQLTFGTWVFIVGIIAILFSLLLHYRPKNLLAIISGLIMGKLIDIWLIEVFVFKVDNLILQLLIFICAIILLGNGIALLVITKFPPTPGDVLMLSIINKFKLNYLKAKTLTDLLAFIVAILIGLINGAPFNKIGIGTLLALFFIGGVIEVTSKFWQRLLKEV